MKVEFLEKVWTINLINLDTILQMTHTIDETFTFSVRGLKGEVHFQGFVELSRLVNSDNVSINIVPYNIDGMNYEHFVQWWYVQQYTQDVLNRFIEISNEYYMLVKVANYKSKIEFI